MADDLNVDINLKGEQNVTRKSGQAKKGLQGLQRQTEKSDRAMAGFAKTLKRVALALGGVLVIRKVVQWARQLLQFADQQTQAQNKLALAMKNSGTYTEEAYKAALDYASSLQSVTRYGDEAIIQGQAMIATFSGLAGDALNEATEAALDLAAGLKVDVKTAFNLIGRAAAGNTAILSRYGLEFEKTGDKAEDFRRLLELIQTRMGGMARTETNNLWGRLVQLKNAFGDLLESVGMWLDKSGPLQETIRDITGWVGKLADRARGTQIVWTNVWKNIQTVLVNVVRNFPDIFAHYLELSLAIAGTAMAKLPFILGDAMAAMLAVGIAWSKKLFAPIIAAASWAWTKVRNLFGDIVIGGIIRLLPPSLREAAGLTLRQIPKAETDYWTILRRTYDDAADSMDEAIEISKEAGKSIASNITEGMAVAGVAVDDFITDLERLKLAAGTVDITKPAAGVEPAGVDFGGAPPGGAPGAGGEMSETEKLARAAEKHKEKQKETLTAEQKFWNDMNAAAKQGATSLIGGSYDVMADAMSDFIAGTQKGAKAYAKAMFEMAADAVLAIGRQAAIKAVFAMAESLLFKDPDAAKAAAMYGAVAASALVVGAALKGAAKSMETGQQAAGGAAAGGGATGSTAVPSEKAAGGTTFVTNIRVEGNVVDTKAFVEDVVAPQLAEAVGKGAAKRGKYNLQVTRD